MVVEALINYDVILLQEHWLQSNDLGKLDSIDTDFISYKVSSMDKKVASGILTGRPFGGVAILCRKSLANRIQLTESDVSEGRFLSIKLLCSDRNIIITCVYFPCISNTEDYYVNSSSVFSHIETTLVDFPDYAQIIGGDFNFECIQGNIGYELFKGIIADFNLSCCDAVCENSVGYTYFHETLKHFSWIDHFFVTNELHNVLKTCTIIDSGINLSDHLPVSCTFDIPLSLDR